MTDVFRKLKPLSWRKIVVPIVSRRANFRHENVDHKFAYRANDFPEPLGPHSWLLEYTIPFRQDIAKGPYKNLFTEVLPRFIAACRNQDAGELEDPVLGILRCRVVDFEDTSDPNRRDGDDIRVSFIHAPEQDQPDELQGGLASISGMTTEAGLLDEDLKLITDSPELAALNEPSPEPTTDPLSLVNGVGRQILNQGNRLAAAMDDLSTRAEKIETTVDKLENPQLWPMRQSARRLRDTSLRIKKRASTPGRTIATINQRYSAAIASVAAEAGMTVQELLTLNPEMAKDPFVLAGTPVRVFRGG